jgi:hypothetical protein
MPAAWSLLKADEETGPSLSMSLKGGHRAKVWAVRAAMKEKEKTRPVKLTMKGALPRYLTATLHILPGGKRSSRALTPVHFFTAAKREANLSLQEDEAAYVIVINDGSSTASLSLEVEEGELTPLDALHMTRRVSVNIYIKHPNRVKEKINIYGKNLKWQG